MTVWLNAKDQGSVSDACSADVYTEWTRVETAKSLYDYQLRLLNLIICDSIV